jgi:glycerol-3-phosphate acyltransferase PlsY
MPELILDGLAIILAYLLGSIPVGFIVVKLIAGRDIREVGSGRTGGTNALRAGGKVAGVLTGLGDFAKGVAAVYAGRVVGSGHPIVVAVCAAVVVAGHNWSIFNRFKGGAGTGPNVGAGTGLWFWTGVILLPAVPLILILTGYASVTSSVIALVIVLIMTARWLLAGAPLAYVGYAIVTTILVVIALIPNYRRLKEGTERMVGPRARVAAGKNDQPD